MGVRVGSARSNENGGVNGGKAGDQTGREVSTQPWYLHSKGWIVIRAKSPAVREQSLKIWKPPARITISVIARDTEERQRRQRSHILTIFPR